MLTEQVQGVGAILVNEHGKILLQQRDDEPGLLYAGHWTTLGGKVEGDETPDEAMRRELLEEIEIAPEMWLWKVYDHMVDRGHVLWAVEQYLYVGHIDLEPEEITLNEGQALAYFDADDLDQVPVAFGFKPVLREFLLTAEEHS